MMGPTRRPAPVLLASRLVEAYAVPRANGKAILPDPWDIHAICAPGRVRGPRVGRLATVNSLKPDATWIRARSARRQFARGGRA